MPRTWDDQAIAALEVPLADPVGSRRHVSADYYYRIPVAPIYKSYPVYVPGQEPPGYIDWLKQQGPRSCGTTLAMCRRSKLIKTGSGQARSSLVHQ